MASISTFLSIFASSFLSRALLCSSRLTAQTAAIYMSISPHIRFLFFLINEAVALVFPSNTKPIIKAVTDTTAIGKLFIAANSPSTQTIKNNTGGLFILPFLKIKIWSVNLLNHNCKVLSISFIPYLPITDILLRKIPCYLSLTYFYILLITKIISDKKQPRIVDKHKGCFYF